MKICSTSPPSTPARSTAALTAAAPSSVADAPDRRALEAAHRRAGVGQMTIGSVVMDGAPVEGLGAI